VSIQHQVLGEPGRDNALLVRVAAGRAVRRFLFDCGAGCLDTLSAAEIRAIDVLFFSHLHIDHVAGFDTFLRFNYGRPHAPVFVVGPAGTARILHHRLRGVAWNLIAGQPGEFRITDVESDRLITTRLLTAEAFEHAHPAGELPFQGAVHEEGGLAVQARIMDHGIPCLAYAVRPPPRFHLEGAALAQVGLRPGPWIKRLMSPAHRDDEPIVIDGAMYQLGPLRRQLVRADPGGLAYLTDFVLDDRARQELETLLRGCSVIAGAARYCDADAERAQRNRHLTSSELGQLAARAGATELVLLHLSRRAARDQWRALRDEVRRSFPAARFPGHWGLG
jgi:ribonuclease Z